MSDFKAKMHQIWFRIGLCPRPCWGSYQTMLGELPDPAGGATRPCWGSYQTLLGELTARLTVNKTILKPRLAAATGGQYIYVGFSWCNKIPHCSSYMISEKAIWFRYPDYNPDRAQKLISSSMSRYLSTRNISFKSMHVFLSNFAHRQTNEHGQKHTSFVGGNNIIINIIILIIIVNWDVFAFINLRLHMCTIYMIDSIIHLFTKCFWNSYTLSMPIE